MWLGLALLLGLVAPIGQSLDLALPDRVAAAQSSVVRILVWGQCPESEVPGLWAASGVILKQDGSVLTAGHLFWCETRSEPVVLRDLSIAVEREERTIWYTSKDLAKCEPNPALHAQHDLALIKLVPQPPGGLKLGEAREGQTVWILGYAELPRRYTAIRGVVTSVGKELRIHAEAPIEPGMSGSPVVTEEGLVIGIVFAIEQGHPERVIAAPALAARTLYALCHG